MEDRYPYLRFIAGAAQLLAAGVAAILLLSGVLSACDAGGFAGFIDLIIALVAAGIAWVTVMAAVEVLQVLLDIEQNTRRPPPL